MEDDELKSLEVDIDAPTRVGEIVAVREWPAIEGYELLRELGRGGMGLVYLGRHLKLNRLVALKTISAANRELEEALVAEARIVATLEHPAIVPVYEVQTSGDPWFFSMGYVDGEDLSRRISRQVLSLDEVVAMAQVLCDGLEHAHGLGVLHLDIKPANILLDRAGNPKIADFGLSALYEARGAEECLGTPQFMSPEQVLNTGDKLTPATDLYSVGAVLYAALAGRPPLISSDPQALLLKVVSQSPPSLREFGVRVPAEFEAIIFHCLSKNPLDRYQSAAELRADVLAFTAGEPVRARPPGILARAAYQLRRHVFAASVSGSAVLLLLLLVAWVLVRTVTQASELALLREDNERLTRERQTYQMQAANRLSAQQNRELNFEVAKALAEFHNEAKQIEVAARYAAEALLMLPPEQRPEEAELMAMVRMSIQARVGRDPGNQKEALATDAQAFENFLQEISEPVDAADDRLK
jgi:eukaryotic-like serine/threonine-protein kinase